MDTSFTNSLEQVRSAAVDQTDWYNASDEDRIRSLEVEGYCVFPEVLSAEQIASIGGELARLPTTSVDYSEHQRGYSQVEWTDSPNAISVVAHPEMVEYLRLLFGDEPICTSCGYAVSEPGHPGIAIHTDAQPYGSKIFGLQSSSPVLVRALYYLDELTRERSPFKVIPSSHLSLHIDGNPYNRFLRHDAELMVTCKAGSAVLINQKVFHGNFPNHSDGDRRMLAIAYRPAWAGPIIDIPDREPGKVAELPEAVQPFFASLNTKNIDYEVPNRPDGLAVSATGIHPGRWST
jgi:ectoine hydroxylase-related dioxygenase (phytanoyl-CoA dioxygenase family)